MTPPAPAPAPLGDDERAAAKTMLAATWRSWGLCVLAPSAWLAYAVWRLPMSGAGLQNGDSGVVGAVSGPGWGWLVGLAVVWLALAGPAVFALRSYCFRALWDGRAVEPQSYLKGMGTVWAVLVVGAGIAEKTETATIFVFHALEERWYAGAYGASLLLILMAFLLLLAMELMKKRKG